MRSGLRQKVDFFQNRVKRVKGILDKCHSQSPGWSLASRSQNLMISGVQYFNVHWVRKSVCAQPTVHWSLEPSMNQWWTITMMNCGWHPRQGSDKKMAWDSKVCGRRFWDWWMSSERTPCRGWGLGWRLCNLWFSQGRYFDVPGSWCICIMFFFFCVLSFLDSCWWVPHANVSHVDDFLMLESIQHWTSCSPEKGCFSPETHIVHIVTPDFLLEPIYC